MNVFTILGSIFLALLACLMSAPVVARQTNTDLQHAVTLQRAMPAASKLPRIAFYEDHILSSVVLSPSGDYVAYLRKRGESRSAWLLPTRGGPARALVAHTEAEQLLWSRDGRWLFLRAPHSMDSVSVDGRVGVRVPMGGIEQRRLIKIDSSQPSAILLRERAINENKTYWRVVRMDAEGKRTLLREDAHWVRDVIFDHDGRMVALTRFNGQYDSLFRSGSDGRLREALRLQPMEKITMLGVMRDGSLLIDGNARGNWRRVLRMGVDDRLHTFHQDPHAEADLDEVVVDPATSIPLTVSYRSKVAATYGVGDAQQTVDNIKRHLPDRDIALQNGGGQWLISERASTLRDSRWHLYNPETDKLRRILDDNVTRAASPQESDLVHKVSVSFSASDGVRVHGFVLLPKGVDVSRAPLVAQVHGGPISHFGSGFDGIAQFLANRGYVVFQSNFRGSTGHGLAYTFASKGDYGNGRVQLDIVEGVQWLLAQGIGDARRVGIVGHSFGGYSTLQGLTFQPELFKVGVAGAPPSDLGWSMRWELENGYQADMPDRSLQNTLRALSLDGSDPATFERLSAQSPLRNVSRMRRPLLVFAGGRDPTVPIRSITHYVSLLLKQDAPITLLVDPQGKHSPQEPLAMEAYLFAMEQMLHAHLGGMQAEPAGLQLQSWMRQNLRSTGPEFKAFLVSANR